MKGREARRDSTSLTTEKKAYQQKVVFFLWRSGGWAR